MSASIASKFHLSPDHCSSKQAISYATRSDGVHVILLTFTRQEYQAQAGKAENNKNKKQTSDQSQQGDRNNNTNNRPPNQQGQQANGQRQQRPPPNARNCAKQQQRGQDQDWNQGYPNQHNHVRSPNSQNPGNTQGCQQVTGYQYCDHCHTNQPNNNTPTQNTMSNCYEPPNLPPRTGPPLYNQNGVNPLLPLKGKTMGRLLSESRADVVLREDVIECSSDPRPNAFFDMNSRVLRVYHGPVYGNPFSTVPAHALTVGSFAPRFGGPPPAHTGMYTGPPKTPQQGSQNNNNLVFHQSNMGKSRSPVANNNVQNDAWGGSTAGGGNAMPGAWGSNNDTSGESTSATIALKYTY